MVLLETLEIQPEAARLLVIDAQNDVCHDNSAYADSISGDSVRRDVCPIQEAVTDHLIPFLNRARSHGLPIGFVQSVYQLGQYSHSGISPKWLTVDPDLKDPEWRIRIYMDMPVQNEPSFQKDTQETFTYKGTDNGLAGWLGEAEDILVAGFTTDGCVNKGVYALLERGYLPVVLEDCVATSGHKIRTAHLATLEGYRHHEIIRVVNSGNIVF